MSTASRTPTSSGVPVAGDCDADGRVTVAELIRAVAIALGETPLADCPVIDVNSDGRVSVDELVAAVDAALAGV
jgi:hypothetical protein